jgi:hypothetical protein
MDTDWFCRKKPSTQRRKERRDFFDHETHETVSQTEKLRLET